MPSYDPINENWIVRQKLYLDKSKAGVTFEVVSSSLMSKNMMIYWTAWYFITTSITTIGYGDIYGCTMAEKLFILGLLFIGIIIFTVI